MNGTIRIYYATGMGNTEFVVRTFSGACEARGYACTATTITDESGALRLTTREEVNGVDFLGIAFPVYGLDIPRSVRAFLRTFPGGNSGRAFIIANAHTNGAATRRTVARMLQRRGYTVAGTLETHTPSTSTITEETEGTERAAEMRESARQGTERFAEELLAGAAASEGGSIGVRERVVRSLFRVAMPGAFLKNIVVSDACTSCGTCSRVCPRGNISLMEGTPQWGTTCDVCMRCLNSCPASAINAMTSAGRQRYVAPDFNPLAR